MIYKFDKLINCHSTYALTWEEGSHYKLAFWLAARDLDCRRHIQN